MNSNLVYEVGGDFLGFFTLTDDVIGIYLGDATGKGPPAALYAALAYACFDPRTGVLRIASAWNDGSSHSFSAGLPGAGNFAAFLQECFRRRNTKAKPYNWNAAMG